MKVHQFLTSYAYGDAIGNEALEIRDFLRANGIESEIFTLHFHPRYAHQVRNYLDYDRFSDPGNLVIYHFSIGSPVTKKFLRLADKKIIIYHNITPYHFFLDFHRVLAKDCFKGRLELKSLADKVDLALGDSEYNRGELVAAGFKRPASCPWSWISPSSTSRRCPCCANCSPTASTTCCTSAASAPTKKSKTSS